MNQKVCIQRMFMSLIFSVMYLLSFAQTRQISGMVKDMSGEPVICFNVSVIPVCNQARLYVNDHYIQNYNR